MTWTTFTTEFDSGQPGNGQDVKRINDNITALANGDAGAPKIQEQALDPSIPLNVSPVVGTTYIQKRCGDARNDNTSGSFARFSQIFSSGSGVERAVIINTVLIGGSFSASFEKSGPSSNEGELYRFGDIGNGYAETELLFSTAATGVSNFTFSANKGDLLYFQYSGSDNAFGGIFKCVITTGNNVAAIA